MKDWEPPDSAEERRLRIEFAFVAVLLTIAALGWLFDNCPYLLLGFYTALCDVQPVIGKFVMKKLIAIGMALAVATPAFAGSTYVKPYVRKDGTYVEGHYRTTPNGTKLDNWSTQGNYNPYNGKSGTTDPYAPPTYTPYNPPRSTGYRPYTPPSSAYKPYVPPCYYNCKK